MPKPSNSFPRLYKNKVEEEPGWNEQVLKWCQEAAQEKGLQKSDYWGGFVIDEMKIQVRVVFNYITNKNLLNIRPLGKLSIAYITPFMHINSKYALHPIYRTIYSHSANVMVIEEIIVDLMDSYLITNNTTYKKTTNNRIASTRKP